MAVRHHSKVQSLLAASNLPPQFFRLLELIGEDRILDYYSLIRQSDAQSYVKKFKPAPLQLEDEGFQDWMKRWVKAKGTDYTGAYLHGPSDSGKTIMASWIGYKLIQQEVFVRFANLTLLLEDLRPGGEADSNVYYYTLRPDLLILDDLGTEVLSSWVFEKVYSILNYRRDNMLDVIATSNFSLDELQAKFSTKDDKSSTRLIARLLKMCKSWSFNAPSS